jgi:hypothetical protein
MRQGAIWRQEYKHGSFVVPQGLEVEQGVIRQGELVRKDIRRWLLSFSVAAEGEHHKTTSRKSGSDPFHERFLNLQGTVSVRFAISENIRILGLIRYVLEQS